MNTTEDLRGIVEYVEHCGSDGQQLEVKIEGHDVAVFLSPIRGDNDFNTGDTITVTNDADEEDGTVHINARRATNP